MIIYTPVPEDKVFEGMETFSPAYLDIRIGGIPMQVEMINSRQAKIIRLYSANPADYMNPLQAPGSIIEFRPCLSAHIVAMPEQEG